MKKHFSLLGLVKPLDFKTKSQNVAIKWVKSLILSNLAQEGKFQLKC